MNKNKCIICGRREKKNDCFENGAWYSENICSLQCYKYAQEHKWELSSKFIGEAGRGMYELAKRP